MSFGIDFNDVVEESSGFSLLPEGNYVLRIEEIKEKSTRSGTGSYLNVKYKVVSPEKYNRRYVFDIVNIKNDNSTAQEIGRSRLKRMLSIAGFTPEQMKVASPEMLVGKIMGAYITHDKKEGYKDREKVSSLSEPKEVKEVDTKKQVPGSWLATSM